MNVLIVRPDGIGDVILSIPVASQLRQLMPGVRIGFLTSPVVSPILDRHPDVDYRRTIRLTDPLHQLRAAFTEGVEAAIFLKPFRRLMWAAFLERVPVRVATAFRWYSGLANRRIYDHRSEFMKHESEYNVRMLRGLDLNPTLPSCPTLILNEEERTAGDRLWGSLPSPRIVVHPGGLSARRWRLEHYYGLVVELARRGHGVILTGSEEERIQFHRLTETSGSLPSETRNLMGQLALRELMGLIASAHTVVSGATGPAHLAAALGTATLSLFDPRKNNLPVRWKPLGKGLLLRPDVPTCDRCIGEACPFWDCLDRLTVSEVADQVAKAVSKSSGLTLLHL